MAVKLLSMVLAVSVVSHSVRCSTLKVMKSSLSTTSRFSKMLAYLLKYDSSQGKYEYADTVEAGEDSITVKGKTIKIYAEKDAKNIPWAKHDVDVVLECTGFYTSKEKASAHLEAGAKKVVISLRQARTSRRSCSTRTISPSRLARRSSPLLPARRTASLRWQRPSMTSLQSRAASCRRSTLSRAIR